MQETGHPACNLAETVDAEVRSARPPPADEVYPLGGGKLSQVRPVRLGGATGVAQQHQNALLPLNEFRMAQFALALQPIEAFAQRGDKGREGLGQHRAAGNLYQIVRLATTKANSGAATVLVKLDGQTADPAVGARLPVSAGASAGVWMLPRRSNRLTSPASLAAS